MMDSQQSSLNELISTDSLSHSKPSLRISLTENSITTSDIKQDTEPSLTNESSMRGHMHTYTRSNCTTGTDISDFIPYSPINKQQEVRSRTYSTRKWLHPNTHPFSYIQHVPRAGHIITQCTTNNSGTAASPSNTNNAQHNDGNDQSNYNSNNGSKGYNNRRNGRDGDDEKKRENDKYINTYYDDIKEEEEEEEEEDDAMNNTAFKPMPFVPLSSKHRSKSLNAVSNYKATESDEYSYNPSQRYRAQGFIKISKNLTQTLLPKVIKETIVNVWDYMDKTTGIALCDNNVLDIGGVKILNYGFHDRNGNALYFVAERDNNTRNCGYTHVMKEDIYSSYQICNIFGATQHITLPRSCVDMNGEELANVMGLLNDKLMHKSMYRNVLAKCNKLPVFHGINRKKEYNTERMKFSVTKPKFLNIIERFICNKENKAMLVPIIMFSCRGYRMEYVQIVNIRSNVYIGISYIMLNDCSIKATGIHLNKESILYQHQLVAPSHDCHCLDDFYSDIDDFHIGNPDDDMNRLKDCKMKNVALKVAIKEKTNQWHQLKVGIHALSGQNNELKRGMHTLQSENNELKRLMHTLSCQNIELLSQNNALKYETEVQTKLLLESINRPSVHVATTIAPIITQSTPVGVHSTHSTPSIPFWTPTTTSNTSQSTSTSQSTPSRSSHLASHSISTTTRSTRSQSSSSMRNNNTPIHQFASTPPRPSHLTSRTRSIRSQSSSSMLNNNTPMNQSVFGLCNFAPNIYKLQSNAPGAVQSGSQMIQSTMLSTMSSNALTNDLNDKNSKTK